MNEESKDLADQVEELDEDGSRLADHAEELRLQAVNSAYKAKRQAQRIRLSKEDRGSLISVASSAGRPKVQPQNQQRGRANGQGLAHIWAGPRSRRRPA